MTGNKHKRTARTYQRDNGGSYTRARREVAKRDAPPLIVSFPGVNDQPVRINLEERSKGGDGPHCLIKGDVGSGKTTLSEHICGELAKTQQSYGFDLFMVQEFTTGRQMPAGTKRCKGDESLIELLDNLVAERVDRLKAATACDITEYRSLGLHMPAAVICIDALDSITRDHPEVAEAVLNAAARGRSLGVHLVLTTVRPLWVLPIRIAQLVATTVHLRSTLAGIPELSCLPQGHGALQVAGRHDLVHFTFPDHRLPLAELDAADGQADTI